VPLRQHEKHFKVEMKPAANQFLALVISSIIFSEKLEKKSTESPRWDLNEIHSPQRPGGEHVKYMQMSGPRSPFRDRSARPNKVVTQTVDHQRAAGVGTAQRIELLDNRTKV
jgi:hypothetical protein